MFSNEPLPLEGLKAANARIDIAATLVKTHQIDISDLKTTIALTNGKLSIDPLQANVAEGKLDGKISLDASGQQAALNQSLRITGLSPAKLKGLADKNIIEDSKIDFTLNLRGQGRSVAEIMGGANGKLLTKVGPGRLTNEGVDAAGGAFLLKSLQMINPLSSTDTHTVIECSVINFKITNGMAANENGIALQTKKLNILGGGTINLKTEALDIGVNPKVREGVGINLAGLAGMVRIRGTLTEPKAGADAKGTAIAGAKIGAAVATGGLSILAGAAMDQASEDQDVCAVALGKKPAKTAQKHTAPDTKTSAPEQKNMVEDTADKVKGVFKGLFGD